MARTYTILQFTDRLEVLAKGLNKAILPPFRGNLKIMQKALYAEYWKNPFAARIWKWRQDKWSKKGGPSVKLGTRRRRSYGRWSASQGAYIAQINISGLAAMLEEGGTLRKHVFWGKGSRKPGLRKPGLPVPRMPVYGRVVENKLFGTMVGHVEESFWKFVEKEL
jgi:hypothetical protein